MVDDTGKRQLLHQSNHLYSNPAISPDGQRVALVQASLQSNIHEIGNPPKTGDVVSGPEKRLVGSSYFDYMHEYSPNGEASAFMSNRHGKHQLWLSSVGNTRAIETGEGQILDFHWAPDGTRLLNVMSSGKTGGVLSQRRCPGHRWRGR